MATNQTLLLNEEAKGAYIIAATPVDDGEVGSVSLTDFCLKGRSALPSWA